MEYARARVKLPPELANLQTSQIRRVIAETPMSPVDAAILKMRYLEQLPFADIGAAVGYDRTTTGRHAASATRAVCSTARRIQWTQ